MRRVAEVRRAAGFTLIEVLIALAITAFVAAASYSGLATVLSGAEQLRAVSERTRDLNRALALLNRDLRQFIDRPVLDEFGELQPALSGGPLALFPLTLTRSGWHNSLQLPRSDMQRVQYYLEDGALWRAYYPILDRASDSRLLRVALLEGVDAMELRFLDSADSLGAGRDLTVDTRNWERNWIADTSAGGSLPEPPAALELRLEMVDMGELRRLYVLPAR